MSAIVRYELWSPLILGMRSKQKSFSGCAASPNQALSRLTM
jgi:hypothetical protein